MKLNNNALQKLYDTLMNLPLSISPYEESPIEKAFRECDEKLSESVTFEHIKKLEKDIDILKRSNEFLLSANNDLASKKRNLEKEIDGLHKHMDILSANEWEALTASKKLEKYLDDVKNQLNYCTHSRDNWRARAKYAEDEVKELKETLEKTNTDRTELQKDRDSYHGLYTELRKDYDRLFEENRKLKARTDCHRYELEWYRKHYKGQSDKIKELKKQLDELTSQYQKLTIENKRLQNNVRAGYDQGQTDLWVKLQNVNDSQPFELATCFPDVTGMEDILNLDLEDFLDAYKKWWEEKEKERLDHMRDYLARFCEGRVCEGCPLESNEYKCGCGYSFKKATDWDMRIIPDEELERYYEKARGCDKLFIHDLSHSIESVNRGITKACEQFCKAVQDADIKLKENDPGISDRAWHGDATAEKVKAACDAFAEGLKAGLASEVKEVPVSCDIPIKDLASWECTIEATVEINKDMLEKVCCVKPDDK